MAYFNGIWNSLKKKAPAIEHLKSLSEKINVYDLGSSGGCPPPFCHIKEHINLINFEPDKRSESDEDGKTFPYAIGPENLNTIYLNKRPTTSSLLAANKSVVDRYDFSQIFKNEDPDIFQTIAQESVQTIGLQTAFLKEKLEKPDFLKIDVQGLSLEVLQSADQLLDDTLGIQIEVEFFECYQGQKTFGEIHSFLEKKGFEIFNVSNLNRWFYKTSLDITRYTGQHTFCDFLYIPSISQINETNWTQSKAEKLIIILLIHNLIDSAAAYYEKFITLNILTDTNHKFQELICSWTDTIEYFYEAPENKPSKIETSTLWLNLFIKMRWQSLKKHKQCYFFGAGKHTHWLLKKLLLDQGPEVIVIIDENPKAKEICGIPVQKPEHVKLPKDALLIASTDCHFEKFKKRCLELFPANNNIINLYEEAPAGPYYKDD
jgi:FkbM family methyltransferase